MDTRLILCAEDLLPYMAPLKVSAAIAVDTETTGLDPFVSKLRLVQLAAEGLPVLIIDCFSFLPEGLSMLREVLSGKAVKVFQNAKFDLQFLMAVGITPRPLFDTMLAARLLYMPGEPRRADLKTLAMHYLGEEMSKDERMSDWSGALTRTQIEYAAMDAVILLRLRKAMIPLIRAASLARIAAIEFGCCIAIAQMEYRGVNINSYKWQALRGKTESERDAALLEMYPYAGYPVYQTTLWGDEEVRSGNFDSNPYILGLLKKNGVHVSSTAKQELYPFRNHPLVKALSSYRKAAKSLSAFLYPIPSMIHPATGRLHPRYGQISAYSGRMSCGYPNIQQIPRSPAFRECFEAPPGRRLIVADYSQIELRVAAQISGDERMLSAYQNGEDLHLLTASLLENKPMAQVGRQARQAAKAVNFGLIYGMGAQGLRRYAQVSYGVDMTQEQAEKFRRRFFNAYPGIGRWHRRIQDGHAGEGRTLTGRRFAFSGNAGLPELSNTPVQGTAADIIKRALGLLAGRLEGSRAWIIGAVHDEILLECPEEDAAWAVAVLKDTMRDAAGEILSCVPSEVEANIAMNWAEK